MSRDVKMIEDEMKTVRAAAAKLAKDGSHFTPDFDALVTRYKILRDEKYLLQHPKKLE